MAIFIVKFVIILIKSTAKPVVNWFTHYNRLAIKEYKGSNSNNVKNFLKIIGQFYYVYLTKFNRRILKVKTNTPIRLLPEEKAVDKGIEILSELLLYTIILGIPVYELLTGAKYKKKEKLIEEKLLMRVKTAIKYIDADFKQSIELLDDCINVKLDKLNKLL